MEINEIEIEDALPVVFAGESRPYSDVWQSQFVLKRGERYIIAAESGTGKSSLCAYIYGSRRDYSGAISFSGENISKFSIPEWQEIRRRHIAYLPQDLGLFPELTAMENIMLKNSLTNHASAEKIDSWISRLGLRGREDFPVGKMSVGQQQRVGIIRALCQPFDFILLDEPVSHLDEGNNRIVAQIVEEEASAMNAAVIATSVGNHLLLDNAVTLHL